MPAPGNITIYLVDDHQLPIDNLKAMISHEPGFEIIGECTLPLLAVEQIQLLQPNIVLTDISMPEMSGIELVRKLKPILPNTQFIALSLFGERTHIKDMLQVGVSGYVLKNAGRDELVRAIRSVCSGKEFFSDEVVAVMEAHPVAHEELNITDLTEREINIIECIAQEMTNSEMAQALFISERTVEAHRKNVFLKTGTRSVLGLVKFALDKGFIK